MFWDVVQVIQDSRAFDLRHVVNYSLDGAHRCVRRSLRPPLSRQRQHEVVNFHQKSLVVEFIDAFRHQLDVAPNALHQQLGELG